MVPETELIRKLCQPLVPQPTATPAKLRRLEGIRAVLFDIYGTLLISASGDVGLTATASRAQSIQEAASALGKRLTCSQTEAVTIFEQSIRDDHDRSKQDGIVFPEVDIVAIWETCLPNILDDADDQLVPLAAWQRPDFDRFAWEYELRVNPVWPMPDAEKTVDWVASQGLVSGVISNAQFFTPLLFPALLGRDLRQLGCDSELMVFSYQHGRAKPSSYLFDIALQVLDNRAIRSSEVLYVGNDMLNDIVAADQAGFQTALFAGDQRSLRMREDDPRVLTTEPTIVLTELNQLTQCL